MTIRELRDEINNMKNLKIDETPLLVGLYRKFSISFSSLVFALLGIPLAIRVRRRERSLGFGLSIMVCLLYYMLMALGEGLALQGKMNPILGVWLPNIILLMVGLVLTLKVIED